MDGKSLSVCINNTMTLDNVYFYFYRSNPSYLILSVSFCHVSRQTIQIWKLLIKAGMVNCWIMSVPVSVICSYINWVINSALFLIFKFSYFFLVWALYLFCIWVWIMKIFWVCYFTLCSSTWDVDEVELIISGKFLTIIGNKLTLLATGLKG